MIPTIIGLVSVTLWLLYKYYISVYKHWESRGIVADPGRFPFGNSIHFATLKDYHAPLIDKMYKEYSSQQYFGYYILRTPILLIRDPEIIRLVLAKEFSHFRDRFSTIPEKRDPLSNHLFNLDGERWRELRIKLTPTFTSGKLKAMFPLFVTCSEDLSNMLISHMNKPIDIKDITARYTTDIICSCAFGLENNSLTDKDNQMRKVGSKLMTRTIKSIIRNIVTRTFPDINKYFPVRVTPLKIEKILMKIVGETIECRERNNIKRNDFLDLLMQLKNKGSIGEELKDGTNENTVQTVEMDLGMLTAQCFLFFVAGFETSSSVQTYCLFELALNQDIQKKVREEILKTIEKHGGVTYQAIKEMEYLDMTISETMRMYPTLPTLSRSCTKSFTTPSGHKLLKGDRIIIPVWSLQHDPQYFPDPEKFDPERFSPMNKGSIKPYTYMPFGEGPRNCIGMRFGLLQTKMGIITILRRFQVQKTEETKVPIQFMGSTVIAMTKGAITLKLTPHPTASPLNGS